MNLPGGIRPVVDYPRLKKLGLFPLRIMLGMTFLVHRVPSLADFR